MHSHPNFTDWDWLMFGSFDSIDYRIPNDFYDESDEQLPDHSKTDTYKSDYIELADVPF